MRRLKKSILKGGAASLIVLLAIARFSCPGVEDSFLVLGDSIAYPDSVACQDSAVPVDDMQKSITIALPSAPMPLLGDAPIFTDTLGNPVKHRVRGVKDYNKSFPDLQEKQIEAAKHWGVNPVADRAQAESRKNELVYVGSNPYYVIAPNISRSIPYLVPRAADLLQTIARNFLDSLAIKGIPAHRIQVTSLLRTEDDVNRLRRYNVNASEQSCHRYGTTFDISYWNYNTVCPPGETRRAVGNDVLKSVLGEVLTDIRKSERSYVKFERRQHCFHITVR